MLVFRTQKHILITIYGCHLVENWSRSECPCPPSHPHHPSTSRPKKKVLRRIFSIVESLGGLGGPWLYLNLLRCPFLIFLKQSEQQTIEFHKVSSSFLFGIVCWGIKNNRGAVWTAVRLAGIERSVVEQKRIPEGRTH